MAHTYRNNGQITDFDPDNDENTLYINGEYGIDFDDIIVAIKKHFGDDNLSKYSITAEHIHTRCLTYDLYDASDYTNYIKITKNKD